MITLKTTYPSMVFSSSMEDLTFGITEAKANIIITIDGESIYDETLYANSEGLITLYDMPSLIQPYAENTLKVAMVTTIQELTSDEEVNATSSVSTEVVYCAAVVSTTAADFCLYHFLTMLQGYKLTAVGRLEYVHFIGDDTSEATAEAYYTDGSTATFTLPAVAGNDVYKTIECSPSLVATEGKTLSEYFVKAGARTQLFRMDLDKPNVSPVLLFTNSFGVDEILYCRGKAEINPTFTQEQAYIMGKFRNYGIEEVRTLSADTGVLTFAMADWAQDLFRSKNVRTLLLNGSSEFVVGSEVTLTDVSVKYNNQDDTLPRFTFKYRPAGKIHNIYNVDRAGRIFDDTFDATFE